MASKQTDKFANKFYGYSTLSAANTLTYHEIQTNVDVFAKKAWILQRLEWYLDPGDIDKIIASGDSITMALTSSNVMTTLGLDAPAVIDICLLTVNFATAVAYNLLSMPIVRDFSNLEGGGIIIAPRPLYIGATSASIATAITAKCRGYFLSADLNADEYLELVDFYRIVQ